MSKINVLDMAGKVVGEFELCDSVFGIEPNNAVMHADVKNYLANQRHGTQSTLTRAEVSGGGRKPRRQKGSGFARQGSTRAPHWVHGGVALGPKPRDYRYSLNKKVKKLAIRSALSAKVAAGQMVKKGDVLVILEAMKMENEIMAPRAGKVAQVACTKGATVNTGDALVVLE